MKKLRTTFLITLLLSNFSLSSESENIDYDKEIYKQQEKLNSLNSNAALIKNQIAELNQKLEVLVSQNEKIYEEIQTTQLEIEKLMKEKKQNEEEQRRQEEELQRLKTRDPVENQMVVKNRRSGDNSLDSGNLEFNSQFRRFDHSVDPSILRGAVPNDSPRNGALVSNGTNRVSVIGQHEPRVEELSSGPLESNSYTKDIAINEGVVKKLKNSENILDPNTIYHFIAEDKLYAWLPGEAQPTVIGTLDTSKTESLSKLHFKVNDSVEIVVYPVDKQNSNGDTGMENKLELVYLGVYRIGLNKVSQCCGNSKLKFDFIAKNDIPQRSEQGGSLTSTH